MSVVVAAPWELRETVIRGGEVAVIDEAVLQEALWISENREGWGFVDAAGMLAIGSRRWLLPDSPTGS